MNQRPPFALAVRLLLLLVPLSCVLAAAPNGEQPSSPLTPSQTALEKQRASVRLQMSRIAAAATRQRARQSAQASIEKQLAAAQKQRQAAERQMAAIRTDRVVYTAVSAARSPTPAVAPVAPVHAATWMGSSDPGCDRISPAEIGNYLEQVAKREQLDPEVLHVVIAQESSFFPCAVSHKGAMGMMQLMPGTAADLGVTNPFDAQENIDGGARYLGYLLERFGGDLRLALAAYNAGPSWVDNYRGVPPFPETINYVQRILGRLPAEKQKPVTRTKPAGTT